jgi:MFS family permease
LIRKKEIAMYNKKRLLVASLAGIACGFICFGLASSSPGELAWPVAVQIIISRTLIGFGIGISSLSMRHWSINGLVMGALFSLPLAFSGLMAPDSAEYNKASMFVITIILGMVYGFLIELVTSVLLKAKPEKSLPASPARAAAANPC